MEQTSNAPPGAEGATDQGGRWHPPFLRPALTSGGSAVGAGQAKRREIETRILGLFDQASEPS